MRVLVVIPARYDSSRFPGKPLALISGQSMIQRVCQRVKESGIANRIVVATDDRRIADHVASFGFEGMMTSPMHLSGTDRCAEVESRLREQGGNFDIIINVQGDEPGLPPENLRKLLSSFEDQEVRIATLITPMSPGEETLNPSIVKVVTDKAGYALYFSRHSIPFIMNTESQDKPIFYRHQGIYAFRGSILEEISSLPPGMLERSERLEQLRWLEQGMRIRCISVPEGGFGIDNPADIDIFERAHLTNKNNGQG